MEPLKGKVMKFVTVLFAYWYYQIKRYLKYLIDLSKNV